MPLFLWGEREEFGGSGRRPQARSQRYAASPRCSQPSTTISTGARLVDPDTVAQMCNRRPPGHDLTHDKPFRYAVVFELPCQPLLAFGGGLAFGHDGLGSLAFREPLDDTTFGFLTRRIPLAGGADRRAIELGADRTTLRKGRGGPKHVLTSRA